MGTLNKIHYYKTNKKNARNQKTQKTLWFRVTISYNYSKNQTAFFKKNSKMFRLAWFSQSFSKISNYPEFSEYSEWPEYSSNLIYLTIKKSKALPKY